VKYLGYVLGLAGVRVVNAYFYNTSLNVFFQRTVLMIVLAYVISGLRARRRRRKSMAASHVKPDATLKQACPR
jgi:hypothetical protein